MSNTVAQMEEMVKHVNAKFFVQDREAFLEVYTCWLFHGRKLEKLSWTQARRIDRMWVRLFA